MRTPSFTVIGLSAIAGMLFLLISSVRAFDTREASLYERLGGQAGVDRVVDNFLGNVADDDRLSVGFAEIDIDWLRACLIDWVCEVGGPCHSDANGPARAHEGIDVTEDEFGLMMQHVADAMIDAGVDAHEHFAAIRLFADMHDDIDVR